MRRRLRFVLAFAAVVVIGAAAMAVVYRAAAFETLLTAALRAKGVPAPRLTVSTVGWRAIGLADVSLGRAGEVTARRARLDYTLSGLLAGRLERVAVDGLTVALDLTGDAPLLGSLQPLLSDGTGGGGNTAPLPPLALTDVRLDAQTSAGVVRASGDGQIQVTGEGDREADVTLREIAVGGKAVASGRLSVRLAAARADATVELRALAGGATATATASAENLQEAPRWRFDLSAEAQADAPLWAALALPAPQSGRVGITATGAGQAPPPPRQPAPAIDRLARLLTSQATGVIDLSIADVSLPERVLGLDTRARLTVTATAGAVALGLPEDATVAAGSVSPPFLQRLGLPGEIADRGSLGFTARLRALSADTPVATLSRADGAVAAALNGVLSLAVPQAIDLSLSLPVDLRVTPLRLQGKLRAPAELRLTDARWGERAELLAPASLTVAAAEVARPGDAATGGESDYRLVLDTSALRLRLHPQGADAIEARIDAGRLTALPGRLDFSGARIEVPSRQVAADGMSGTLIRTDAETRATFTITNVRRTGADALIVPVTVTGQVRRDGNAWLGTATAEGPGGLGIIDAKGRHEGATGRGTAAVAVRRLVFKPGGLQPGTLAPALASLQAVSGDATGEVTLSWSAQGVQGTGTVALRDIGFTSAQGRVDGLNLTLRLDRLMPPASPPGQTLSVRRLAPGLPFDRLDVRFQIQPTDPPSLAIETGEVFFGSGRLAVTDLVIDPGARRQEVALRVQDLSLAELFAILGIDGLTGDGTLSGTIPMTFSDGTVVIADARLAASAPGTVRFRSEQAAKILAGQGESLDLVLRALEDFRYEELTVDLEKSADDVGRIKLGLLGKNPAVLEGYPFRFNISIEANTGKLITALTALYQVPNDLLRRAWTSAR